MSEALVNAIAEQKTETAGAPADPANVSAEAAAPPAADPAKPADEKKDFLSPRFAALARKEKEARKALAEAKKKEQELTEREARLKKFEETNDPLELLKLKNYSYQDVTNRILNDGKASPEEELRTMKQQMADWMKSQEEAKQKSEDEMKSKSQAELEETISEFKVQIGEFIDANAETYELIHLHDQAPIVYDTIAQHWDREQARYEQDPSGPRPKVLSIKEACELVEKFLEDQVEKTLKTKKMQSRLAPKPAEEKKPSDTQTKTLTNDMSSGMTSKVSAKTDSERMARALAALNKQA